MKKNNEKEKECVKSFKCDFFISFKEVSFKQIKRVNGMVRTPKRSGRRFNNGNSRRKKE